MAEVYRIGGQRLTGIADQARRLGKKEGPLTPEQIQDTLRGVVLGNQDPGYAHAIGKADNGIPCAVVTEIPDAQRYYFNGVLLPAVPKELLAKYPYCWLRDNGETYHYELFLTEHAWSHNGSSMCRYVNEDIVHWYRIEKAFVSTKNWEWYQDYDDPTSQFGGSGARPVIWTNHNVYQSTDGVVSKTVWIYWSRPVPYEEES